MTAGAKHRRLNQLASSEVARHQQANKHLKVDQLPGREWAALLDIQHQQLTLLRRSMRSSHFVKRCGVVAIGLLAVALSAAADLPTGSQLPVRLTTSVSTRTARPGDPVSAVLVADVPVDGGTIAAGTVMRGVVRQVSAFTWKDPQAALWLDFNALVDAQGAVMPVAARVVDVDNARETIDRDGRILGIVPPRAQPSRAEDLVLLAAFLPEVFAMETAQYRLREEGRPDIEYRAGVDMTLETLTSIRKVPVQTPDRPSDPDATLRRLVGMLPTRTTAGRPPRAADLINFLLVGTEQQITSAFREAGWNTADALGLRADVKTILAVAEDRGYQTGPVSAQWLDGKPPDLVFQKQNNTFAKRHHIRIWRRSETWQGRPVWVGAGTHDIAIKFVTAERSFTHQVDARIDREREKIVADLRFTGLIDLSTLVDRPSLPTRSENATKDPMETDGRIAIVVFR